jgi:hypothetical protein
MSCCSDLRVYPGYEGIVTIKGRVVQKGEEIQLQTEKSSWQSSFLLSIGRFSNKT